MTAHVWRTLRRAEYFELLLLFFVQGAALAIWFVPLSLVLDAHGLQSVKPLAFAASAVAAVVSPLVFGALADRQVAPVRVLRWLALASATSTALAAWSIRAGSHVGVVLALIQLVYFCSVPTWSISSAIVFSRLADAPREFGPIRAMATLGWMAGGVGVGVLGADGSTSACFAGAFAWLLVMTLTFLLPVIKPAPAAAPRSWRERLGLDALALLQDRSHRGVFVMCALFNLAVAGFYPYAPPHLRELGFARTSAWMSLAQVTEILAMLLLGTLLARVRLKWVFVAGLVLGVLRFAFSALDTPAGLMTGVILHGCSFTFVIITGQIYLEQRVDPAIRARAQALMSVMNGGVGGLLGYLGAGWWFALCTGTGATRWSVFWGGLSVAVGLVLVFFVTTYRGRLHLQRAGASSAATGSDG